MAVSLVIKKRSEGEIQEKDKAFNEYFCGDSDERILIINDNNNAIDYNNFRNRKLRRLLWVNRFHCKQGQRHDDS